MKTKLILLFALLVSVVCAQTPSGEIEVGALGRGGTWKFNPGAEFPGAKGMFETRIDGGRPVGVLTFDFSEGGKYVAAFTAMKLPSGYGEIRFRAKSEATDRLAVRLVDATNQVHQFGLAYSNKGEWQDLRVELTGKKSPHFFGGANDGRIHYPIKYFWLLAHRPTKEPVYGEVLLTDVKALP